MSAIRPTPQDDAVAQRDAVLPRNQDELYGHAIAQSGPAVARLAAAYEARDEFEPICAHEMAAAHAATFPSRAAEYGLYLREFLEVGTWLTSEQLAAVATACNGSTEAERDSIPGD